MKKAVTVVIACAMALTACGGANQPGSPGPSGTATGSTGPGSTATQTAGPGPTSTATPAAWSSGPTVVTRSIPVPPVPRLLAIRSAAHTDEGYDRVVFDFDQTIPGYDIRYVDTVIADGSGLPVTVPGRRFLRIAFRPAQAHDDSGTPSVTPRAETLGYPMMKAYAITGDFEGVVTVVLGLDDVVGYRVGELPGTPARLYVDVAA